MKKIIKNNLLEIVICLNILFIFINSFLFTSNIIEFKQFGKSIIYSSFINLIISIIIFIYKKFIKKKYKFNILDILVLLILFFGIISVIFAIYPRYALEGAPTRYEGFYAILYYFSLFYISSFINKKNKKKVAFLIVLTGVVQAFFGYLQITDSGVVEKIDNDGVLWAIGLTNNPNFFASYILITLSYALGLFIDEKEKIINILLIAIIIILTIGLLVSNTLSCVVGLFTVLIILLIYSIKTKKYKKLIIPIAIIASMFIILDKFNLTTLVKDFNKTKNETVEIAKGNVNERFGTSRIAIWKEILKKVPDNLINGVGIDNIGIAYDGGPLIIGRKLVDKAHNELLQILVTEGIFCLLCYLAFYGIIVVKGTIRTFKKKEIYLLLPVVGYIVQSMFNISVIEVAPIFYISLGLLIER